MQPNTDHSMTSQSATLEIDLNAQRRQFTLTDRLADHKNYSSRFDQDGPCGYFCGRAIIGPFTKVHGGVHPGVTPREAIVVDESHGDLYAVYMELLVNYLKQYGKKEKITGEKILPMVSQIVKEKISLRTEAVPQLHWKKGIEDDEKVALDFYINSGFGAERHQVLLAAYLVEKLIDRGLISGVMQLEVSLDADGNEIEKALYYAPDGKTYCFDPRVTESEVMLRQLLSDCM